MCPSGGEHEGWLALGRPLFHIAILTQCKDPGFLGALEEEAHMG